MASTDVTEFLTQNNIKFELLPHSKSVFTCEEAATERKRPISEMVKCMLLVDKDSKFVLACLPGDARLNTEKVRALISSKRLSFASKDQIKEILSYEVGAISPLPPKQNLIVIWDIKLQQKFKVNVSSGNPNLGLEVNRKDLVNLINPKIGDISD